MASLELLRKGVAGAKGDTSAAGVLAGFYTIKDETLDGLLPAPVTFTAGQPQAVQNCLWFVSFNTGDKDPKISPFRPTGSTQKRTMLTAT